MPKEIQLVPSIQDSKLRIDIFLSRQALGLSRSYVQRLIEQGNVKINGKRIKASHKVSADEKIVLVLPEPEPLNLQKENIPLDIVYEDDSLVVVNKPAGMVVHPAAGVKSGTLVNALLYHCKNLSGIGGTQRPGIVHRLDKGTSGLLMVAKNDVSHQSLSNQLKNRTITRKYLALVYGEIKKEEGFIETQIGRHPIDRKRMAVLKEGGRKAGTYYKVIRRYHHPSFTLVECKLTTGRTHQIRVHLSHFGHPVVGDTVYGKGKTIGLGKAIRALISELNGQALHAQVLGFSHPVTGESLGFSAKPPLAFQKLLNYLHEFNK